MRVFKCMDVYILKYTLIQYCVHYWHWKTSLNLKPSTMTLLSMVKSFISEICSYEIPWKGNHVRKDVTGKPCHSGSPSDALWHNSALNEVKGSNLTPGQIWGPCQIWVLME